MSEPSETSLGVPREQIGLAHIVGQPRPIESLRAAMQRDNLAHAYLFWGPDGVGKRRAAHALFAALQCERAPGEGCGQCGACRLVAEGHHPDVRVIRPEGKSRIIKIAPVRDVAKAVAYPPMSGKWKCVLIEDADRFNEAAGNALLKTLEEPSSRTVFVLLTPSPHLVLATIVSRCQKLPFGTLDRDVIAEWLRTTQGVDGEVADTVAGMSEGSLGHALEQLDDERLALRRTWYERFRCAAQVPRHELIAMAEDMGSKREQLIVVLDLLRMYLRDVLVLAAGGADSMATNRDALEGLRAHAQRVRPTRVLSWLEVVEEATRSLHVNTNPRLAAERVLLELARE